MSNNPGGRRHVIDKQPVVGNDGIFSTVVSGRTDSHSAGREMNLLILVDGDPLQVGAGFKNHF